MTPSLVANAVSTFVSMIEPLVPEIASMAGASASLQTELTTGLTTLSSAATALGSAETSSAGSALADVENGVEAVLNVLAAAPLPPQAVLPVRAASMFLPMLFSVANMLFGSSPAPTPAA